MCVCNRPVRTEPWWIIEKKTKPTTTTTSSNHIETTHEVTPWYKSKCERKVFELFARTLARGKLKWVFESWFHGRKHIKLNIKKKCTRLIRMKYVWTFGFCSLVLLLLILFRKRTSFALFNLMIRIRLSGVSCFFI